MTVENKEVGTITDKSNQVLKLRMESEKAVGISREEFIEKFTSSAVLTRKRVSKGPTIELWSGHNPARDMIVGMIYSQYVLDKFILRGLKESGSAKLPGEVSVDIALKVELAELVNETKSFKFWTTKAPVRSRVLDEAADVLHFLLSRALLAMDDRGVINEMISPTQPNSELWVSSVLVDLVVVVEYLLELDGPKEVESKEVTEEACFDALRFASPKYIVELLKSLGIDLVTALSIYEVKHDINYERQLSGY